jgi:two-component system cell cycle sensor histidine kinase/response regulator CckA
MHSYTWRVRGLLCAFIVVFLLHILLLCIFHLQGIHIAGLIAQAAILIAFLVCEGLERMSNVESRKKRSLLARASRIEEIQGRRVFQHQSIIKILADRTISSGDRASSYRRLLETASGVLKASTSAFWKSNGKDLTCIMKYEADNGIVLPLQLCTSTECGKLGRYLEGIRVASFTKGSTSPLGALIAEGAQSALATPVYHNGQLEGVIVCSVSAMRRWKLDEQDFLASLGDITALINEISARREAEAELRIKSLAIDEAMEGVLYVDNEEKILFANRAVKDLVGCPSIHDIIGHGFKTLFSPLPIVDLEQRILPQLIREGSVSCESEIRTNKSPGGVAVALSLSLLSAGGMIVVIRDITGLKKAEREARESARFLRQVIDTDPNLIFVKDTQGRFTLVNKAVLEIFDVSMSEILGKSDFDLNMPRHQAESFQRADKEVISTKREVVVSDEKLTDQRGRNLRFQTVKRPLVDINGRVTHVLGVACDITARKDLEERLTQKQKLEAVGQLAGGIAHDFNNLLTGVLGYSKLIHDAVHNKELESHADNISRIAQKASDLTEQLLTFARKGKNRNVSVEVNRIVEDTLSIISRTISPEIMVKSELSKEPLFVLGDPTQLQQVVLNLCINARDAMTRELSGVQGGTLNVRSRLRARAEVSLSHSVAANRDTLEYVELSVTDTGCGMSAEVLSRCFEPFYTTKLDGPGAGMGLAMVYGIVESHQGFISVESSPFFGSTFRVYLPRTNAIALPEKTEVTQAVAVKGIGNVLLVDDHQEIREVTSQMLKALGYNVDTASDGIEAVSMFLSGKEYELVVLDVIMPKMSGKECFKEIRRLRPHCAVVFSTGYLGNHALGEELLSPKTAFVQKPYRLEHLSQVVAALISKGHGDVGNYLH